MEPYQYFTVPIMDDKAQVAIIALLILAYCRKNIGCSYDYK